MPNCPKFNQWGRPFNLAPVSMNISLVFVIVNYWKPKCLSGCGNHGMSTQWDMILWALPLFLGALSGFLVGDRCRCLSPPPILVFCICSLKLGSACSAWSAEQWELHSGRCQLDRKTNKYGGDRRTREDPLIMKEQYPCLKHEALGSYTHFRNKGITKNLL